MTITVIALVTHEAGGLRRCQSGNKFQTGLVRLRLSVSTEYLPEFLHTSRPRGFSTCFRIPQSANVRVADTHPFKSLSKLVLRETLTPRDWELTDIYERLNSDRLQSRNEIVDIGSLVANRRYRF